MYTLPLTLIPRLAFCADIATATDAKNGMIVSERDYASTFLTTLRNIWRLLGGTAHYQGWTNPKSLEDATGTDFALAVANDQHIKIALIEAKRTYNNFDSKKKKASLSSVAHLAVAPGTMMSRFSDEIARQHETLQSNSALYIAQAFISLPIDVQIAPDHFRLADHKNAFDRIKPNPPPPIQNPITSWSISNQSQLLASQATPPRNMEELLSELIACHLGKPIARQFNLSTGTNINPLLEQVRQHLNTATERKSRPSIKNPSQKIAILVLEGYGMFGPESENESKEQQA